MRLSRLLEGISDISVCNFVDTDISSVTVDSRRVRAGGLFVAIRGARYNGEDFIKDAYRRGGTRGGSSKRVLRVHA